MSHKSLTFVVREVPNSDFADIAQQSCFGDENLGHKIESRGGGVRSAPPNTFMCGR